MHRPIRWKLAALLIAAPSYAQDFSSIGDMGISMGDATLNQVIMNNTLNPALRAGSKNAARSARPDNAFANGTGSTSARYGYEVTPALARQAVDGYVARAARTGPDGARLLAAQFRQHDYREVYRSLVAGTGLRDNDAVDALTAYTVLGWLIANGDFGTPDPRAVQATRGQIAARVGGSAAFAPARRAPLGEELKLQFVTLHAGWQGAQREGKLRDYSDKVSALFQRNNVDLRALRLTPGGLAAR